jgi:hypothetical protein
MSTNNLSLFTRIKLFALYLFCRIVGHKKQRASVGSIGVLHCSRCHRITDTLTVRRRETKGDAERIMERIALMTGYSFTGINWKKRIAHFTKPNGQLHTVPIGAAMRV